MLIAAMSGGREFMSQPFQGQALQHDFAWTGERRKENALTAEDGGTNTAHHLNVVSDARIKSDEVSGLHLNLFAGGQIELHEIAARMYEHFTRTGEFLENEAFAAKQTSTQLAN